MISKLLNQIHFADSFEFIKEFPEHSIDFFLEDMCYNMTACEWDEKIDIENYWKSRLRVLKPKGVIALTASQPFTTDLINGNRKMFRYEWIWYKVNGSNFMNLQNRPLKTQEAILIFSPVADFTFNPIPTSRTELSLKRDPIGGKDRKITKTKESIDNHYNVKTTSSLMTGTGLKHPIDVITFPNRNTETYDGFKHPTRKPSLLFEYLIRTYTNEGDTIFDGFGGSGTTAIAAFRSHRNFIVVEKDQKYFKLSQKRLTKELKEPNFWTPFIIEKHPENTNEQTFPFPKQELPDDRT
jgi:site-specific DNA-methyltransferase (adenine-specific)